MTDTATIPTQPSAADSDSVDAFAERVFGATLGTLELLSMHLGDRMGWYEELSGGDALTPAELAQRTGTVERYAREWLEQQATYGILQVTHVGGERHYVLPASAAEVLTDAASLSFLTPLVRMIAPVTAQLPALEQAYRTGGGVSWAEFGDDLRRAQADANRPWFEQQLGAALAGVPSVDEVLRRPGARIADVGFGFGWSSIALARAYPEATVTGFDVDDPSAEAAREHAAASGVSDRVRFVAGDAAELPEASFDAVFAFECLHDMPQPVEVLAAARRSLEPGGFAVVMDEAVGEDLSAPGDEIDRLMYGISLLVCLPDGLSHPHSAGTGTVMRPSTLRRYAEQAGFSAVEVLPISDFSFFRFYRLIP